MYPLLAADGLGVSLGGRPIVQDVSFEIAHGELAALLGPNGCGKTTTLRAIMGLVPASRGTIRVEGADISSLNERRRARLLAYVPQAHEPPFAYSVRNVAELGRTPYLGFLSQPTAEDERIVLESLERLGLEGLQDQRFDELSGGQQQLVLIARALAQQPRLLVLDEPCANLDFGNQLLVLRQIRALAQDGIGVLMVTHDPNHVLGFADHVLAMQQGRVIAQGTPADVLSDDLFWQLYHERLHVADIFWEGHARTVCIPW